MQHQNESDDQDIQKEGIQFFTLAIVGAGPSGLTAAYKAAENNAKVLIIEKRGEEDVAIRPQRVVLWFGTKQQFLEMIKPRESLSDSDIKFIETMLSSGECKISAIQRFILNRINYLNTSHIAGSVTSVFNATLESLELENGKASYATSGVKTSFCFKNLVAADGANSKTHELLNQSLSPTEKIQKVTPSEMRFIEKTHHFAIYLTLSNLSNKPLVMPDKELVTLYVKAKDESSITYNNSALHLKRESLIKSNYQSMSVVLVGQISKDLYESLHILGLKIKQLKANLYGLKKEIAECKKKLDLLKNSSAVINIDKEIAMQEEILTDLKAQKLSARERVNEMLAQRNGIGIAYAKKVISQQTKQSPEDFKLEIRKSKSRPEKDNLKLLVFRGQSKLANKASLYKSGHGFYLLGDAYFTPNYPLGHGLNDGIAAATKLENIISAPGERTDEYHQQYNDFLLQNAQEAIKKMDLRNLLHKFGFLRGFLKNTTDDFAEKNRAIGNAVALATIDARGIWINITNYLYKLFTLPFNATTESMEEIIKKWKKFIDHSPFITYQYSQYILEFMQYSNPTDPSNPNFQKFKKDINGIISAIRNLAPPTPAPIIKIVNWDQLIKFNPYICRMYIKQGFNPFVPIEGKKLFDMEDYQIPPSIFAEHFFSLQEDVKFGIECLLACKIPDGPLYDKAQEVFTDYYISESINQLKYMLYHERLKTLSNDNEFHGMSLNYVNEILQIYHEDQPYIANFYDAIEKMKTVFLEQFNNYKLLIDKKNMSINPHQFFKNPENSASDAIEAKPVSSEQPKNKK